MGKDLAVWGLRFEKDGIEFLQYLDDIDKTALGIFGLEDVKRLKFKFPNGYGISVIRGYGTYGNEAGLFEVAVLKYDKKGTPRLTYETPVAKDVVGYLSGGNVLEYMVRIYRLPPHTPELPK